MLIAVEQSATFRRNELRNVITVVTSGHGVKRKILLSSDPPLYFNFRVLYLNTVNEKCFIILNQVQVTSNKASKSINALSHTATSDGGSGDYGGYITDSIKDDDGFDVDDSDYDIFIEEVGFCDVSEGDIHQI